MKARVILFKESGKYYTEEEWEIPEDAIGPYDMDRSKDFHRIGGDRESYWFDGGKVLVPSQHPWGFPHLL